MWIPSCIVFALLNIIKAHAREPAKVFFTTGWEEEYFMGFSSPDIENSFSLQIEKYTRVDWEGALYRNASGEYLELDSSRPSYNAFVLLVTDGKDLEITPYLEHRHNGAGSGWGIPHAPFLESELFHNQPGCTNGVDLEGNLIQSVSLRMDFETSFFTQWSRTFMRYNFTVLFEGRPLAVHEDALAVVEIRNGSGSGLGGSVWTVDLVLREGPFWALQRHVVDFKSAKENEVIPVVDEYGTHTMYELLSDGIDGIFGMDTNASFSTGWRESDLFHNEIACYNGIDLEGSYVERVDLEFHKIISEGSDNHRNTVYPRFVFWGNLGKAPPPEQPTLAPTREIDSAATLECSTMRWFLLLLLLVAMVALVR